MNEKIHQLLDQISALEDDLLKAVIAHRADHQADAHRASDVRPARAGRTHMTTNLKADQIAARYGDRILSRMIGLAKAFEFTGEVVEPAFRHGAAQEHDVELGDDVPE